MSEDKPKVGNITFKCGKASIVIDEEGNTESFGIDFICHRMRTGVKGLQGYYASRIRAMVSDLRARGYGAVADVRKELKVIALDRRQGVRDLCRMWDGWLGNVYMMRNMKSGQGDSPLKKYNENYDKIFGKAA